MRRPGARGEGGQFWCAQSGGCSCTSPRRGFGDAVRRAVVGKGSPASSLRGIRSFGEVLRIDPVPRWRQSPWSAPPPWHWESKPPSLLVEWAATSPGRLRAVAGSTGPRETLLRTGDLMYLVGSGRRGGFGRHLRRNAVLGAFVPIVWWNSMKVHELVKFSLLVANTWSVFLSVVRSSGDLKLACLCFQE